MPQQMTAPRVSSVVVACALALSSIVALAATAPPAAAATTLPPLAAFSGPISVLGSWAASDLSSATSSPGTTGAPSSIEYRGHQVVISTSGGTLEEVTADGIGGHQWNSYDLGQASGAPSVTGGVALCVDGRGHLRIFARSTSDHLIEVVDNAVGVKLWNAYDLTQISGAPGPVSNPTVARDASGAVHVFYASGSGQLFELRSPSHSALSWRVRDVTTMSGGPDVVGSPSAARVATGHASVAVVARTSSGNLVEFADDNAHHRIWTAYDLTVASAAGTLAGDPTAANAFGRVVVAGVRGDGSILVLSTRGAGTRNLVAADFTSGAHTLSASSTAVALTSVGSSLVLAARSTHNSLLVYRADPGSDFLGVAATNATKAAQGTKIVKSPSISVASGQLAVYAGKLVPPPPPPPSLADRIVAIGRGQDQNAAKVAETPMGSNCNPYTAYYGRGVTTYSGGTCPSGTRSESWCADFAQWVWQNAGAQVGGLSAWSYTFVDYGKAHGTWKQGATNNPQPGDAVIFGTLPSGSTPGYGSHVGIVTAVKNGMIKMVSGNWGDAVIETGFFNPTTDPGAGYPIIGYSSPVAASARSAMVMAPYEQVTQAQIDSQDQGR